MFYLCYLKYSIPTHPFFTDEIVSYVSKWLLLHKNSSSIKFAELACKSKRTWDPCLNNLRPLCSWEYQKCRWVSSINILLLNWFQWFPQIYRCLSRTSRCLLYASSIAILLCLSLVFSTVRGRTDDLVVRIYWISMRNNVVSLAFEETLEGERRKV